MSKSENEKKPEDFNIIFSRIIEKLTKIINYKKIEGIKLYNDIYCISKIPSYTKALHKRLSYYFKMICESYLDLILKNNNVCEEYLKYFYKISLLLSVVSELFTPLSNSSKKGIKKEETLFKEMLKIFENKIVKIVNLKGICLEMLKNEIDNFVCKNNSQNFTENAKNFDKTFVKIFQLKTEKIKKIVSVDSKYQKLSHTITKKDTLLTKLLYSLETFKLYTEYYEKDALLLILNFLKQECKEQKDLSKMSGTMFNSIFVLVSKTFLPQSFVKIIKLLDQEIILNFQKEISLNLILEIHIQFNIKKNKKEFFNTPEYFNVFRKFPSFSLLYEECFLKYILFLNEKNLEESFENLTILLELLYFHEFSELEMAIMNGYNYKINNKEGTEEELALFIHNIILKKKHKIFLKENINLSVSTSSELAIFQLIFAILKRKEYFFDFYLIYLEKRLLSGEIFLEREILKIIKKHETENSFLKKAEKMIQEIEKSKKNAIFGKNIFLPSDHSLIKIEPLILGRNNYNFNAIYKVELPLIQKEIKKILPFKNLNFQLEHSFCLVKFNDKIIQMTLLHYLVLIDYPVKLENNLLKQIKDSLNNIKEETYILELKEEKINFEQKKDYFLVFKAKLINFLKRNKSSNIDILRKEFNDEKVDLIKVIDECVSQRYLKKENEVIYYLP
ncbi:hypothetical protein TUBRATIS_21320 [Tubulinosema ratisbonensis]|uniref:Cullin family profile domain-containing protein n=1 Tax=Tubulinosema ratisbonensis TaxID=291195 RepID=A0A437AJR5_9MICR|nr:hypothetical protein TUBRATIS_21320 [Tubulinosema ratisbonensis]